MALFEVAVLEGDTPTHQLTLSIKPLSVGRAPANDLVLTESTVSWHHVQIWLEGEQVWMRDLNSRNGTFINNERVQKSQKVYPGTRIRVGSEITLQILGERQGHEEPKTWILEDLDKNIRFPVTGERFSIGSGERCDLRLPDGPDRAATLLLHPDGLLEIGIEGESTALEPDVPFEVSGRSFSVSKAPSDHPPTAEWGLHPYPYRAEVSIAGPTGPQGLLIDPRNQIEMLLTGNRGVLLYVLAKKLHDDRNQGLGPTEEGWCNDQDVAKGIWGRLPREPNALHVLVYRLRKAVEKKGLDPWFIEKRQWGLRVRLSEITLL